MTFEQLNLHPSLIQGVRDQGYDTPTPIQAQAIPRRRLSHFDYTVEPPSYLGRPAAIALQNRIQQPMSLAARWASMNRRKH